MSSSFGVVLFIVALLLTILIHEAAHFGAAKWFGIKVEEFFVGFGPKLWSFRRGETEYGVKALPLGGYVRIAGMNPLEEPSPEDYPRTYGAKPPWQRAIVIAAGPATHFVIAFLFFSLWLGVVGELTAKDPVVDQVARQLEGQGSPAAQVGLHAGDRIVRVDGIEHPTSDELVEYTRDHVGEPISITVLRDGRTFSARVTPVLSNVGGERVGRIGVVLGLSRQKHGFFGSITEGGRLVGSSTVYVVKSLGRIFDVGRVADLLFGHAERRADDPASVVGVARAAGETAKRNLGDLLVMLAVLNIFIGILNLLPLPPFDGGHLAVVALEKISGRKVDVRRLVPLTAVVAAFLLFFVGSLLLLDIVKPIPFQ